MCVCVCECVGVGGYVGGRVAVFICRIFLLFAFLIKSFFNQGVVSLNMKCYPIRI